MQKALTSPLRATFKKMSRTRDRLDGIVQNESRKREE